MQASRKIGAMVVLTKGGAVLMGYNLKKGAWELPGGKMDTTDEQVVHCALRELKEETDREPEDNQLAFYSYVDTGDEYLVLLFHGAPDLAISLSGDQPNPESDKYMLWKWFYVYGNLPDRITWLSSVALKKMFPTLKIDEKKILPCPFKYHSKSKGNEVIAQPARVDAH